MPKAAVCTAALLRQEVASLKLVFPAWTCSAVCTARSPVGYGPLLSGLRARERASYGTAFRLHGNTRT